MSISAVNRSFRVLAYLKIHGEARFGELAEHLKPISHTALSHLLASLVELRQVTHEGRRYALHPNGAALGGVPRGIYSLSKELRSETHPILERTALDTMHACALFGWVGISTMRILDMVNLESADWTFNPVGYEWPLVPFHGFAQVFLAHASDTLVKDCFYRWHSYLQGNLRFATFLDYTGRLTKIRKDGCAVEYRGEVSTILRLVVPVNLTGQTAPRYAVGLTANAVHLLEAESALKRLRTAARELAGILDSRAPLFQFAEEDELIRNVEQQHRRIRR
jgi:DNA-binding HxlR family transcriptional regulator